MESAGLGLLLRSSLRFLRAAPGSTLSVFAGVAIGVLSITGVHLLGESVGLTLESMRPPHLAGITHVFSRQDMTVGDYAELRAQWRRGEHADIEAMVPLREGQLATGERITGVDWVAALDANLPLVNGMWPQESPADGAHGAPVIVEGHWPQPTFTLAGINLRVAGRIPGTEDQPRALHTDIGTAVELLGDDNRLDAVLVRYRSIAATTGAVLEAIMPGISAGLPTADLPRLDGWQVHAVDSEAPAQGLARAVLFNLGALGSLSLLVSLLLMYQTAVIWLRRQKTILRALHELGVDHQLLGMSFVLSLLVLGLPATALGIYAGEMLSHLLLSFAQVDDFPVTLPEPGIAVLLKATLAGAGVCIVGGGLAWWRERREPPSTSRTMYVSGGVLLMLAVLGLVWPAAGLTGVFFSILCIAGLSAFSVAPLLRRWRRVANQTRGPLWMRLGIREVTWYPEDLAVACAALALAVAVSIGVGVMVDSFRREFLTLLEQRLVDDLYVTLDDGVDGVQRAAAIREWPGVGYVSLSGQRTGRVEGLPVIVSYTEFTSRETARYGYTEPLRADEGLINETLARKLGREVGDILSFGEHRLRIVGIFKGYGDPGLRLLVDNVTAHRLFSAGLVFDRLGIRTLQVQQIRSRLETLGGSRISSSRAMRREALLTFDRTFATTDALTWLALLVACGALFNALTGFRLNQQATGRLLDTLGVGPAWNLLTSLVRAAVIGAVAIGIALPLGLWLGWVLCAYVNPRAFGWTIGYSPSMAPLLLPVTLAAVATLGGGLAGAVVRPPWRRAS